MNHEPNDLSDWSRTRRADMTPPTLRVNRTLHARDNTDAVGQALDQVRASLVGADSLPSVTELETFMKAAQRLYGDTLHAIANNARERTT